MLLKPFLFPIRLPPSPLTESLFMNGFFIYLISTDPVIHFLLLEFFHQIYTNLVLSTDLFLLFFKMVSVYVGCAYEFRCPWKPEGASNPLELDLQAIVCYLTLVLGTKLKESARALCTLSLSLDPTPLIYVSSLTILHNTFWSHSFLIPTPCTSTPLLPYPPNFLSSFEFLNPSGIVYPDDRLLRVCSYPPGATPVEKTDPPFSISHQLLLGRGGTSDPPPSSLHVGILSVLSLQRSYVGCHNCWALMRATALLTAVWLQSSRKRDRQWVKTFFSLIFNEHLSD